jgi:hypothetical protein
MPFAANSLPAWLPMYPAPPVTKTFINLFPRAMK